MTEPFHGRRLPAATVAIEPDRPNLDTELRIAVTDLAPGTEVTLRAELRDQQGRDWRSTAGGTPAADARARAETHRLMLEYLAELRAQIS
jgi:hypothetical protein